MVKYFENSFIFQFKWDQVVQGFWKRYPNPESTHVLTEDTIFREVRGYKLFSKRLLTKTNRVPKWGEHFVGSRIVRIIEESIVDPKNKVMVTYTRNIGYTRVMSVVEKVVYQESRENPQWTVARRCAWVDSQLYGFRSAIEAFGLERLRKNCSKMNSGFEYILKTLFLGTNAIKNGVLSTDGISLAEGTAKVAATTDDRKGRLKDAARETAKKAAELAKSKARPVFAQCQPSDPS
ncbi:protein preli-like [Ischnura elegans]|uniref:protein preli-like n=1 Tax=Ischnura elegans TaxID=197161 RepID=UPI001ED898CE|nr:protein preli-like [Ischnura elegans]XP_046385072.1 protein preli-like [Ischnura elegans]